MADGMRRRILGLALRICATFVIAAGCASATRIYYLFSELRKLEGNPYLGVAPGPWKNPDVPIVTSNEDEVPDTLAIPLLQAMMRLPGAADACDATTNRPRRDATEYCVGIYKTPRDWRATWPVRLLTGENDSCRSPYGGVDDEEFGSDLPIFGFAHNHPCGTGPSSPDLITFPVRKSDEGLWTIVTYAVAPGGKPALDSHGRRIPAWVWLATGRADKPRYYKWNSEGKVFEWVPDKKIWEFRAICEAQSSDFVQANALPPRCSPELR